MLCRPQEAGSKLTAQNFSIPFSTFYTFSTPKILLHYYITLQKERGKLELRSHGTTELRIGRSRLTVRSSQPFYTFSTFCTFLYLSLLSVPFGGQQTTEGGSLPFAFCP